jgi:YARHG domain
MRKLLLLCLAVLPLAACNQKAPAATAQGVTPVPAAHHTAADDGPLYYEREITKEDLEGRSLRELSLMRNTIYARAGNTFRKKWLKDYFSAQPWYHPLDKVDESKITALDRKNAEIIAKYDASLTQDELFQMQNQFIMGNGASTPEERIEFRLLSARLGKWKGADTDADRTPLEDPSLLDKQLTVDQLKDFSRRDLRMLRNLIYARRGRPFHSDLLRAYFQAVDWYKPDPKYTEARLTDLDKRNINVVLSVENELGGPLTDWQHKKEDGWFERA